MERSITLETAKLIINPKSTDYWNDCPWFYVDTTCKEGYWIGDRNTIDINYPKPTQSLVKTYLRNEHQLHISIEIDHFNKWYFIITHLNSKHVCCKSHKAIYDSYEDALEIALRQCFNFL